VPGSSSQPAAAAAAAAETVAPGDVWLELPGLQLGVVSDTMTSQQVTSSSSAGNAAAADVQSTQQQHQSQNTGPDDSGSVSSVGTDVDVQLQGCGLPSSAVTSSDSLVAVAGEDGAAVGATVEVSGEMPAELPAATAAAASTSAEARTTQMGPQQQLPQQQPVPLPTQQCNAQLPFSSSSTLARYAAYLDESAARGITPPGLTAATAKALRDNLLQAAALSSQQQGLSNCYTGLNMGLGGAAGMCYEVLVASNALDVFVGSSLGHIRRKLVGKTSSAVWGPATHLQAASRWSAGPDQHDSVQLNGGMSARASHVQGSSSSSSELRDCGRAGPHCGPSAHDRAAQQNAALASATGGVRASHHQQQQLRFSPSSGSWSRWRPGGGYQYTTLEDTLAFIRRHRAVGAASAGLRVNQ
jgi:hypothetical protein